MCTRWLSFILAAGMAAPAAAQVELPIEFQAGEPASADAVNANFDAVTTGLNDLATRVTDLEPGATVDLPLAVEVDRGAVLRPVHDVAQGGVINRRGESPTPEPLVVRGLPGDLSALIEDMALSRRIVGRLMRVEGGTGTPLLTFTEAYVTQMDIPAVGPGAQAPFRVALTVEPGEAEDRRDGRAGPRVAHPGRLRRARDPPAEGRSARGVSGDLRRRAGTSLTRVPKFAVRDANRPF
jgi:hypothetical protein